MANGDNIKTIMRSVRLPKDVDESVSKYALSKHISASKALRQSVEKGLAIESYTDEQDMIRGFIREEIETVLDKQVDRIIRLVFKSTQASLTMKYVYAYLLEESYTDDAAFANILATAHKLAHLDMKQKEQPFEYYLNEARELMRAARAIGTVDDM